MSIKFTYKIHKNIASIQLITFMLGFVLMSHHINAQNAGKKTMVQSSYYDAVVLYYATKNYKAFPVEDQKSSAEASTMNVVNNGNPNVPLFPGQDSAVGTQQDESVKKYKVIESTTGKIIIDNLSADKINAVLLENRFSDADERKAFIYEVLARNANSGDTSEANIQKIYKDNVYFNEDNTSKLSFLFDQNKYIGNYLFTEPLPFSLEGGAGINQTQILEGITEFLIEAVNKEINEAFFIHLQKALAKYDELRILFPESLETLNNIEITKYASSLNALKAAFEEDIKNLLSNVSKLADLKKYQDLINKHPVLTLIFTACDLISLLQDDAIPADILYQIGNAPYIRKCNSNNFSSTIKLAVLISNSLRNVKINDENTNTIGWIGKENLNSLKDNSSLFQIFMGLFAQQAESIIFFNNQGDTAFNFQKSLFTQKKDILKTRFIIYNFSSTIEKIKDDVERARAIKRVSSKKSDYINVYLKIANEIIGLSENCLDVLASKTTTTIRTEVKTIKGKYIPILEQVNLVLTQIEKKEYSGALYQTDTLLRLIFESDGVNKELEEIRKSYIKYGLFICSVAEAKNSDDVKAAINAVALPTGSSRIKKENRFSIGLNAYVGVFHASNIDYKETKLPKSEFGITAPIGIALNWGKFLGKGSFTLYGGLIDVGAIFTYKVENDSTIKSDINFGQVFSPSIGVVYGLPIVKKYNIPLSIGVNYQWGPKLKEVEEKGNSTLPLLAQRFNVFIAVDIPIMNFHVSRK